MPPSLKPSLRGKTVLLGLSGSIALYKSCDLVRRLKDEGADVFCLMTPGAQKFVAPLTFASLSGHPVVSDPWDTTHWKAAHLDLADKSDIFIIAPASADCLARLAAGMADDAVTMTALSIASPVILAPAMHESMWKHPATEENVRRLKSFGHRFIGPEKGPLSQGGSGWGRLAEVPAIIEAARKILSE